jgi:hypothetical protein
MLYAENYRVIGRHLSPMSVTDDSLRADRPIFVALTSERLRSVRTLERLREPVALSNRTPHAKGDCVRGARGRLVVGGRMRCPRVRTHYKAAPRVNPTDQGNQ